jgi:cysteinylglycine-S-conjugate dipeptidase
VLTGRQVFERGSQIRCARVHRVDRQPIVGPGRELSPAAQDTFPGGLGESLDVPGSVLYPVPEDAVVAALDDDELQLGIQLTGKIPPLSTSGLRSVDGIDNDIVPESQLLGGQGRHDEVRSVVCRRGLANSCAPHRRFSLIHSEHGAVQRPPEIDSHRALPGSRQSGDDDQHFRSLSSCEGAAPRRRPSGNVRSVIPNPDALAAAVRQVLPSVRADLETMIRIPSVSADPAAASHVEASADLAAVLLSQAGLPEVEIVRVPGGQPAVLAHRAAPPGAPTVLLYAHHDVQPAGDPAAWTTDPFEPQVRGGRLYGRGAADDKAGLAVHLGALRAHGDSLPVGVTVLVEGEEEIGSPALTPFLDAFAGRLGADVVVFADATNWTVDVPALTTTLRGGVNVIVETRTLRQGVHSGLFGGPAPDALTALCRILATLHDEHGDVAVPGLVRGTSAADSPDLTEAQFRGEAGVLDGVQLIGTGPLTDRLWAAPAVAVIGLDAPSVESASNTLIPSARAKVSLRIAPGDDPIRAREALTAHLQANAPWGVQVTVLPGSMAAAPFTVPPGGRAYRAAHEALAQAWGVPAVDMGVGGSIPFVTAYAERFPAAEILVTGVEDPETHAHGPDESLHLAVLERATLAEASLLSRLS